MMIALRTIGFALAALQPFLSSHSAACFIVPTSKQISQDQFDDAMLASVRRLGQIFEAEILQNDIPGTWRLKVGNVFLGSMKKGQILQGVSSRSACNRATLVKGDRGLILAGWQHDGLGFQHSFLESEEVASLKRVGLLPANYHTPRPRRRPSDISK